MAQQTIDTVGATDSLKTGGGKINANFTELYAHSGNASNPHGVTAAQAGAKATGAVEAIATGGTGQTTAQAAIDSLSAVSGATNEHVLTKDTASGNAKFKAVSTTFADLTVDTTTLVVDPANNRVGVGTANPSHDLDIVSTRVPAGLDFLERAYWSVAIPTDSIIATHWGRIHNTGSAAMGIGHGIGFLGHATDVATAQHMLYGLEGKVQALGLADYVGALGQADWQGADFTGQILYGVMGESNITTDGTTPNATGMGVAVYAKKLVGGAAKYSFLGFDPMRVDSSIGAYDAAGANSIQISHSGTDGQVSSSLGNIFLSPAAGSLVMLTSGSVGFIPIDNGLQVLGASGFEWLAANIRTIQNDAGSVVINGATQATLTMQTVEVTASRAFLASDLGKMLVCTSATAVTLTVNTGLPSGFNCGITQDSTGVVTVAAGTATVVNRQSQFSTAGQGAVCGLVPRIAADTYTFGGDTA